MKLLKKHGLYTFLIIAVMAVSLLSFAQEDLRFILYSKGFRSGDIIPENLMEFMEQALLMP